MNKKMPIIIDTDIGSDVDDLFALVYVLLKKDIFNLKAVSTVYGRTELRAAIVGKVLETADVDNIPVIPGIGQPLSGDADIWETGQEGVGIIDQNIIDQFNNYPLSNLEDLYIAVSSRDPGSCASTAGVTILALGPLTNIAALFQKYPGVKNCINRVIIMGGNFGFTDNAKFPIEHNFKSDPTAVDLVLKSGVPLTILGADITQGAVIDQKDVYELQRIDNKIIRILTKEIEKWFKFCREYFDAREDLSYLHDPLTVACLSNPEYFRTEKYSVKVVTEGNDRGKVFIEPDNKSHISIVVKADINAFKVDFMKTLLSAVSVSA